MNILYVINHAGTGGTERYIETLAARKRPEDSVHFIYNESGGLCARMEALGATPLRVNMRGPFDISAAKHVADYCAAHQIDVIHTQFQRENYISVLAKLFCPYVRVVYTSHIILKNNLLWKLTNSVVCRGDDAVIAVCNMGARLLAANKMPKDRIRLVFNGVPYEDRAGPRQAGRCFTFITVTRFSEEKGMFFLLESVAELKSLTDQPFQVVFVGDGPLFEEAVLFADRLEVTDRAVFMGYRTDAAALLEGAHVFINSSSSESLSFAILEAMGKGLAVIATNVGGNPDIVNAQTNCGALVEYGDAHSMARAMLGMMNDPGKAQAYGENARRAVRDIFNLDIMVEKTYQIYDSLRRKTNDN